MIQTQTLARKKRVGILGGSFDPPTLGHAQMAAETINLGYVDEVWMIPCGSRNDKSLMNDSKTRYNMTKLLISDFFKGKFPIKVNNIEVKNGPSIKTYDLMKRLENDPKNKDIEFYLIIGSDLVNSLENWYEGKKLKNEIKFLIFYRLGYPLNLENLPKQYSIIQAEFLSSSSTEVRRRLKLYRESQKKETDLEQIEMKERNDHGRDGNDFTEPMGEKRKAELSKKETIIEISDARRELENKYLGIYGIVPLCIIEYIKKHNLYNY